jgi:ABC-type multidrug transport system fused ATPase/permease subunit
VRAVLRKSKLVILDEATAHVDADTEKKVQTLLASEFKTSTMLKIAHRLDTLTDGSVDRIIVMRDGRIVEQGRVEDLGENSQF